MTALLARVCSALGVVFVVLALVLPWRLQRERRRHAQALQRWVRTEAVVLASSVRRTPHGQTVTGFRRHPEIRYAFTADGAQREGTRLSLSPQPPFVDAAQAQAWLAAHAPGRRLPVWYDPRDPSSNALALEPPAIREWLAASAILGALAIALFASALAL